MECVEVCRSVLQYVAVQCPDVLSRTRARARGMGLDPAALNVCVCAWACVHGRVCVCARACVRGRVWVARKHIHTCV